MNPFNAYVKVSISVIIEMILCICPEYSVAPEIMGLATDHTFSLKLDFTRRATRAHTSRGMKKLSNCFKEILFKKKKIRKDITNAIITPIVL